VSLVDVAVRWSDTPAERTRRRARIGWLTGVNDALTQWCIIQQYTASFKELNISNQKAGSHTHTHTHTQSETSYLPHISSIVISASVVDATDCLGYTRVYSGPSPMLQPNIWQSSACMALYGRPLWRCVHPMSDHLHANCGFGIMGRDAKTGHRYSIQQVVRVVCIRVCLCVCVCVCVGVTLSVCVICFIRYASSNNNNNNNNSSNNNTSTPYSLYSIWCSAPVLVKRASRDWNTIDFITAGCITIQRCVVHGCVIYTLISRNSRVTSSSSSSQSAKCSRNSRRTKMWKITLMRDNDKIWFTREFSRSLPFETQSLADCFNNNYTRFCTVSRSERPVRRNAVAKHSGAGAWNDLNSLFL